MPRHSSACPILAPQHTQPADPGHRAVPPDPILRDLVRLLARQAAADWLATHAEQADGTPGALH